MARATRADRTRVKRLALAALALALLAAAVPAGAYVPTSRTEAAQIAQAIGLRADDLPAFEGVASPPTPESRRTDRALARCAGLPSRSERWANADSRVFGKVSGPRLLMLQSNVEVWSSEAHAQRELAGEYSTRGIRCAVRQLERSRTRGVRFDATRVSRLQTGDRGVKGVRVRVRMRSNGETVRMVVDAFSFRRSSTVVSLSAIGMFGTVPAQTSSATLQALRERAEQQLPATAAPGLY